MPRVSVTCPSCGKTVDVDVMHVGVAAVMAACPACGEGPAVVDVGDALKDLEPLGDVVFLHLAAPSAEQLVPVMRLVDADYAGLDDAAAAARVREELDENGHLMVMFPREHVDGFAADLTADFPDVRIVDQTDFPAGLLAGAMQAGRSTVNVETEHEAMNAAIARARADVGRFLARLAAPEPGDGSFAVKAPLREGAHTEHVWLSGVRVEGDAFVGTVANDPEHVSVAKLGDAWRVPVAEISDWAFENGERMHGHYTLRVMLPYFPDDARATLESRLAPLG